MYKETYLSPEDLSRVPSSVLVSIQSGEAKLSLSNLVNTHKLD